MGRQISGNRKETLQAGKAGWRLVWSGWRVSCSPVEFKEGLHDLWLVRYCRALQSSQEREEEIERGSVN